MSKARKTKGAPWWYAENIRLNDTKKQRIYDDILGIETDTSVGKKKAKTAVQAIEFFLSAYKGAVQSVDNAPRPANFLAELQGTKRNKDGTYKDGLRKQANDLMNVVSDMSYWMRGEFEKQGYDIYELSHALAKFQDICRVIEKKYEGHESRGTPSNKALKILVNTLRKVFDHYYSTDELAEDDPEKDSRKQIGKKSAEILFIRECVGDDLPETDDALRCLFYDDSTPAEERLFFNRA